MRARGSASRRIELPGRRANDWVEYGEGWCGEAFGTRGGLLKPLSEARPEVAGGDISQGWIDPNEPMAQVVVAIKSIKRGRICPVASS